LAVGQVLRRRQTHVWRFRKEAPAYRDAGGAGKLSVWPQCLGVSVSRGSGDRAGRAQTDIAGPHGVTVTVTLVARRVNPLFSNSRRLYVPGVAGIVTGNDVFVSALAGGFDVPFRYRQLSYVWSGSPDPLTVSQSVM